MLRGQTRTSRIAASRRMAVPLERNREAIDAVLKQIPEMFANNRHGSPVGTAAVKACVEALKPVGDGFSPGHATHGWAR